MIVTAALALAGCQGSGDDGSGPSTPAGTPAGAAHAAEAELAVAEELLDELDRELEAWDGEAAGQGDEPAPPADRQQLDRLRQRAQTEIDRRITTLAELTGRLSEAERLTTPHRAALLEELNDQRSELAALRTRVTNSRRLAALRSDLDRIVADYRVYTLSVPKARGVVSADLVAAAIDRVADASGRLRSAVDETRSGRRREAAEHDLETVRARLEAVRVRAANAAPTLLSLQADGYPANRPTLEAVRADLRAAAGALREAMTLARAVGDAVA